MTEHTLKNHCLFSIAAILERSSVNSSEHLQKTQRMLEDANGSRVIPVKIPLSSMPLTRIYFLQ